MKAAEDDVIILWDTVTDRNPQMSFWKKTPWLGKGTQTSVQKWDTIEMITTFETQMQQSDSSQAGRQPYDTNRRTTSLWRNTSVHSEVLDKNQLFSKPHQLWNIFATLHILLTYCSSNQVLP